ncbi:MAG: phosphate-binding protein, partial [Proteobacteria bacterium]|nr:phosphate-binding protein [Pseudomonadota bacterium]
GYSTSGVRSVLIAKSEKDKPFSPSYEYVETGKYPISRFLFLYILKNPSEPLDPLVKEFLTYVVSFEGQGDVAKEGYYPLSARLVDRELKKLD